MAETKKFYWLKLKNDFFKRHDIRIIESMPNGKDYILFYLKLLVESISHDGSLRFSDAIPYNDDMLSTITNTNVDIVRSAIKIFTELDLMEMLDDGTIFMLEVKKMIGCETEFAQKKREYRRQIEDKSKTKKDKVRQEIELEIEKEIDIKDNRRTSSNKFADDSPEIQLSEYLFSKILALQPKAKKPNIQTWAAAVDKMIRLDGRTKEEIRTVIDFAMNDSFWQSNILSTVKLRKQFDQLMIQSKRRQGVKTVANRFNNHDQRNYDHDDIQSKMDSMLDERMG